MKKIAFNDKIFATVVTCGRTIFSTSLCGMTSMEEIVRKVSGAIRGSVIGIVTLIVRNGSQGWSLRQSLRLGVGHGTVAPALNLAAPQQVPVTLTSAAPEGLQLSLF